MAAMQMLPNAARSPPPEGDSMQGQLRSLLIAMLILPSIVILIRFWSRSLLADSDTSSIRAKYWWDDWTALAAAMLNIATLGVCLRLVTLGMGLHTGTQVSLDELEPFLKLLWIEYYLFDTGTAVAKTSALFFYARVFGMASPRFNWALWIVHGMNIAWLVGITLGVIFECTPIERAWKPTIPGTCVNTNTLWLSSGISSLLIDVIILLLPIPKLLQLQMKPLRKVLILGVFICGYMVVVVSIGRLISIVKIGSAIQLDPTYSISTPILWLGSEIAISVTSVSLPSIFYLAQRVWRDGFSSLIATRTINGSSQQSNPHASNKNPTRPTVGYEDSTELMKSSVDSLSNREGGISRIHSQTPDPRVPLQE